MKTIKKWLPIVPVVVFVVAVPFVMSGYLSAGWFAFIALFIAVYAKLSFLLVDWLVEKLSANASRNSRTGVYIGAYGIYPFAVYLGLIVSLFRINFSFVSQLANSLAGEGIIREVLYILITVLCMFIVATIICTLFALLGFFLGWLIESNKWFKEWCDGQATRISALQIFNSDNTKDVGNKTKFVTYSKWLGIGNAIGWAVVLTSHCIGDYIIHILHNFKLRPVRPEDDGLIYILKFLRDAFYILEGYEISGILIMAVLLPINLYIFITNRTDDAIKLTYANIVSITLILVWLGLREFTDFGNILAA